MDSVFWGRRNVQTQALEPNALIIPNFTLRVEHNLVGLCRIALMPRRVLTPPVIVPAHECDARHRDGSAVQ